MTAGAWADKEIEDFLSNPENKVPEHADASVRHYLAKRLSSALALLPIIEKKSSFFPLPTPQQLGLHHEEIIGCIQKINQEKNLQAVNTLWVGYLSHNFKDTTLFAREFILTLIVIYASIHPLKRLPVVDALDELIYQTQDPIANQQLQENFSLQHVMNLYNAINDLPLLNLLATIDFLVVQVQKILQAYQLTSSLSWKEWFMRYWWVAPVTLFALLRVIIRQITMYDTHYTPIYRTH
jgi:hypothetical protein